MISRFCGLTPLVFVGMLGLYLARPTAAQPPVSYATIGDQAAELEARAEAALARQVSVDFVDTPLRDFAAEMGKLGGVNCVLRLSKLAEADIAPDSPVTVRLRNVPLEVVLWRVLSEMELTLMVQDGVLVITTPEDAGSPQNLISRIYPVRDLVDSFRASDNQDHLDFTPLIDLIDRSIEPDSWQEVGGPASVDVLEKTGSLLILQRREIHHKIGEMLITLRKVKRIQNIPSNNSIPNRASAEMPTGKLSRSLPVRSRGPSTVLQASAAPTSAWQLPQLYSGRQ